MKNLSLVAVSILFGLLSACSSTQETKNTDTTPTTTVTVPTVQSADPAADKTAGDKPADTTTIPKAPEATTPKMEQCTEASRKMKSCPAEKSPVCADVDTGIRCIRAPCPSTMQQNYDNACTACMNKNVRGYWTTACENIKKPADPNAPAVQ